jgi:hypothetical protein
MCQSDVEMFSNIKPEEMEISISSRDGKGQTVIQMQNVLGVNDPGKPKNDKEK